MSTLNEIEARLAAATPGPWEIDEDGDVQGRRRGMYPDPELDPIVTCSAERPEDTNLIAHAPADLAALVAVVREVEQVHQPGGTVIREVSYDMEGTIPGPIRISGFQTSDLATCKGCSGTWPCPTAAALQRLGGAS